MVLSTLFAPMTMFGRRVRRALRTRQKKWKTPPRLERLEDRTTPAFTATLTPENVVTFLAHSASDWAEFRQEPSGYLWHNRAVDPGFESDTDLDSATPGVQSLRAADVAEVRVQANGQQYVGAFFIDLDVTARCDVHSTGYTSNSVDDGIDFVVTDGLLTVSTGASLNFASASYLTITAGSGDNRLDASAVSAWAGRLYLHGGAGDDVLIGGAGDDWLGDTEGANTLAGGAGDDTLEGRGEFDGGAGTDWGRFYGVLDLTLVDADVADARLTETGGEAFDWASIERAYLVADSPAGLTLDATGFTRGTVFLVGNVGPDTLLAGPSGSYQSGNGGNDRLVGGSGYDVFSAGDGDDRIEAGSDSNQTSDTGGTDALYLTATAGADDIRLSSGLVAVNGTNNFLSGVESVVLDAQGGGDTVSASSGLGFTIHITNLAPRVNAGADVVVPAAPFHFTTTASFTDPYDPAGSWSARVDYGDGAGWQEVVVGAGSFVLDHEYAAPGRYAVTVEVSDSEGNTGTDSVLVRVAANEAPLADAGGPYSMPEGVGLFLDASASTDPDGDALHFRWTVNGYDLGESASTLSLDWAWLQAHGMGDSGTYAASVEVSDDYGGVDVASAALTVSNVAPNAILHDLTLGDDGALDPSFGMGGLVLTDFPGPANAHATDAALQPDGKLLVAGNLDSPTGYLGLCRYTADGSLDRTFGVGGRVAILAPFSHVSAVALQPDGKIVVAGGTVTGDGDFVLSRFDADGRLDATFGDGGTVVTDLGGADFASGLAVDPSGRIVAVGHSYHVSGTGSFDTDFAITRYDASGRLDSGFASGGVFLHDFDGSPDWATAVRLDASGRILVAGTAGHRFGVIRLTDSGALDASFGGTGAVALLVPGRASADALAVQQDGTIVLAGSVRPVDVSSAAAVRLTADGNLDPSFGSDGLLTLATINESYANDVVATAEGIVLAVMEYAPGANHVLAARLTYAGELDSGFDGDGLAAIDFASPSADAVGVVARPDGRVVLVGSLEADHGSDFALAQLTTGGALDSTFGGDGRVTTSGLASNTADDTAVALLKQADGKLIAVGQRHVSDGHGVAAARYNADGSLDATFGDGGRATATFAAGVVFYVRDAALLADGKVLVAGSRYVGGEPDRFAFVRFLADGTLDEAFGIGGLLVTPLAPAALAEYLSSVAVQPDGKVVAAGAVYGGLDYDLVVVRYNSDFTLDESFGTGGIFALDLDGPGNGSSHEYPIDLTVQPDGRIVVAASVSALSGSGLAVVRLSSAGVPDEGFGTNGVAFLGLGQFYVYHGGGSLAVQADGRIVVAANGSDGMETFGFLVRLTGQGEADGTFDADGVARLSLGGNAQEETVTDILVSADGIVVAGQRWLRDADSNLSSDFALARLYPDGRPDESFGENGTVSIEFGGYNDRAAAVLAQDGGDLVVAGTMTAFGTEDFALARLISGRQGSEGTAVEFNGSATDPSQPDVAAGLSYAWTVTDASNTVVATGGEAAFTFTPADDGEYRVTLAVTDKDGGTGTSSRLVRIDNVAPSLTGPASGPVSVAEGTTVIVGGVFTDPAMGVPSETFTGTALWSDGESTPVTVGGGTFSTSRAFADETAGPLSVIFTISDDDGGVSAPFSVSGLCVTNVAPSVAADLASATANEGGVATMTGTWGDPGVRDVVTLSASVGTVAKHDDGTWNWVHAVADGPADGQTVLLTATDSDGASSQASFELTVDNVAPMAREMSVTSPVFENGMATLNGLFTDPSSADTFTLTVDWGDGSDLETFHYDAGTSSFSETHRYLDDDPGGTPSDVYTVSATLADDDGGSVVLAGLALAVQVDNVAPVAANHSLAADEDSAASLGVLVGLTDAGSRDAHTAVPADFVTAAGARVTIDAAGNATYDPRGVFDYLAEGEEATDSFGYTARDDDGGEAAGTVSITIAGRNDAPTLTITNPSRTVQEGASAGNDGTFADLDLTDVVTVRASVGTVTQDAGHAGSWAWSYQTTDGPDESQTVVITATDSQGAERSSRFELIVENVAPSVDAGGDRAAYEGDLSNFAASVSDPGALDAHEYLWEFGDGATSAEASPSHAYADEGTYRVKVSVRDDDMAPGEWVDSSFDVFVSNVPPRAAADGASVGVDEGGEATMTGTWSDPGIKDLVTVRASVGTVTTNPDGTWTWTYTPTDGPLFKPVLLNAFDGGIEAGLAMFDLFVRNVAPTPFDRNTAANSLRENAAAGTTVGTTVGAADPGDDTVRYSLTDDSGGRFVIDPDSGVVTVAQGAALDHETEPTCSIVVRATDSDDAWNEAPFEIAVTDVNEAPSVALANAMASLPENAATPRVKVADIMLTDDALGSNALTLSGADAGLLEIDGLALYLKAGAALDFEANPSLDVTVEVDDPTVGSTPDAVAPLSIAVTDVNEYASTILTGSLFLDHDANGTYSPGHPDAAGWTVYLDTVANGRRDPGERTATTNQYGGYGFVGLDAGTYTVRVDPMPGDVVTSAPAFAAVAAVDGAVNVAAPMGVRHQLTVIPVTPIDTLFHPVQPGDWADDLVRSWYRSVLGREADAVGLAYWSNEARTQAADAAFAGIWYSREHRIREVQAYYRTFLGREADGAAWAWVDFMANGAGESEVAAGILASQEFANRCGGSDEGFVRALYPLLFGRAADDIGLAHHVGLLRAGWGRYDLARGLMRGREGAGHAAEALFSTTLERSVDPFGNGWNDRIESGAMALEAVARALLTSEEFRIRATA